MAFWIWLALITGLLAGWASGYSIGNQAGQMDERRKWEEWSENLANHFRDAQDVGSENYIRNERPE